MKSVEVIAISQGNVAVQSRKLKIIKFIFNIKKLEIFNDKMKITPKEKNKECWGVNRISNRKTKYENKCFLKYFLYALRHTHTATEAKHACNFVLQQFV